MRAARCLAAAAALALLGGCVSTHKLPPAADSATLEISGNSSNFFTDVYENTACKLHAEGSRLATFYGPTKDGDAAKGKPVRVAAGKPLIFTHYYIDARFAQNRTCAVTVSFVPEHGKTYRSQFQVDAEVTGCDTAVVAAGDTSGANVPSFKYNENLCVGPENRGPVNRKARWINWRVNFVPIYTR